ncbi:hypothetical protein LTR53_013981, partial [Teratosphaeriaceae sp. CCFEE 6253]
MAVLPHLFQRAATIAKDTRALEARQHLPHLAQRAARTLAGTTAPLLPRTPPTLAPRQNDGQLIAIPLFYQYGGPAPAAVAGIVLGSVLAFLLLMWLFWSLSNGGGSFIRTSSYQEELSDRRRSRSPRSRRSSRQTEMRSRSPPRRERVIRQERIVRDRTMGGGGGGPPPPREPSRIRETVIVDDLPRMERRVDGDDIAGLPLRTT